MKNKQNDIIHITGIIIVILSLLLYLFNTIFIYTATFGIFLQIISTINKLNK